MALMQRRLMVSIPLYPPKVFEFFSFKTTSLTLEKFFFFVYMYYVKSARVIILALVIFWQIKTNLSEFKENINHQ